MLRNLSKALSVEIINILIINIYGIKMIPYK